MGLFALRPLVATTHGNCHPHGDFGAPAGTGGQCRIVLTTVSAMMQYVPPRDLIGERVFARPAKTLIRKGWWNFSRPMAMAAVRP